jgi:6,7-dimethyl-8-ribityllumazine synthase
VSERRRGRIAILVARFNSMVTEQLREGAERALAAAGIAEEDVGVFYVPGAWELPQAATRLADRGGWDAIVTLGCVIRGETAHFDFVAGAANDGLGALARNTDIPIIFGVLTTENPEQALDRADIDGADKGGEAARAALDMMELYDRI